MQGQIIHDHDFAVGDVMVLENPNMHPSRKDNKMHIFIADYKRRAQFLVINKNPSDFYKPHYPLLKKDYPFLEYDSYVGCNSARGIQALLPPYTYIKNKGRLEPKDLKAILVLLKESGIDDDKYQIFSDEINYNY